MTALQFKHWRTAEWLVDSGLATVTPQMIDDAPKYQRAIWAAEKKSQEQQEFFAEQRRKNKRKGGAWLSHEMRRMVARHDVVEWLMKKAAVRMSLQQAILRGMDEVVEERIKGYQTDPQAVDEEDRGVLSKFSWGNYLDVLRSPLPGHLRVISHLLESKVADPWEIFPVTVLNETTQQPETERQWALFVACEKGNVGLYRLLWKHSEGLHPPPDVNLANASGTTCLWIAACNRHVDLVEDLLNRGADPNKARLNGDTALCACCQKGNDGIVELLLAAGARVNLYNKERDNPVLLCCRTGKDKILEMLLRLLQQEDMRRAAGQRLEYKGDEDDWTVKEALGTYAEIDGFPPLLAAAELNRVECLKVCLKYGADLEYRTAPENAVLANTTALLLAVFYNRLDATQARSKRGLNWTSGPPMGSPRSTWRSSRVTCRSSGTSWGFQMVASC